jgi:hypothetical protein
VSDALWARTWSVIVAALPGSDPGTARRLLNALLYQALTGGASLDAREPDSEEQQAVCRLWRESGLLEQLTRLLLVQIA